MDLHVHGMPRQAIGKAPATRDTGQTVPPPHPAPLPLVRDMDTRHEHSSSYSQRSIRSPSRIQSMELKRLGPHVRSSPTASPWQSDASSESQHSSSNSKVVEEDSASRASIDRAGGT